MIETCKTLVHALIISRLEYGNSLLYNISLSLTNHLQRVQNCAVRLMTRTRKAFCLAALASCTFQIIIQDPVSYLQSTEWNSTIVSKRSDRNIYTSENAPIWVLVTFEGIKKPYSIVRREILPSISSQAMKRVSKLHTTHTQQIKTYFVRFFKPIHLNWRIYNIKPVSYVWNVFKLYEFRICFNCVSNVNRLRAILVE